MTGNDRRVAIITGGSQGIGASLVAGYLGRGWAVVANARTIGPSADPGVLTVEGDIAKPATADRIVEGALERFGRIDTLVNNAGVFVSKPFTDYTAADYALLTGVNLGGFFWLTQRSSPRWCGGTAATWSTSQPPWPRSRTRVRPRCWPR